MPVEPHLQHDMERSLHGERFPYQGEGVDRDSPGEGEYLGHGHRQVPDAHLFFGGLWMESLQSLSISVHGCCRLVLNRSRPNAPAMSSNDMVSTFCACTMFPFCTLARKTMSGTDHRTKFHTRQSCATYLVGRATTCVQALLDRR
jgi:hypothetical protein